MLKPRYFFADDFRQFHDYFLSMPHIERSFHKGDSNLMKFQTAEHTGGTIRPAQKDDLSVIARIWLEANIQAHSFIPSSYWQDHLPMVEELLPQAEVFVYETLEGIQGFLGMNGDYIEGIFIRQEARSRGIGKTLINCAKSQKHKLRLSVYCNNTGAVKFYQREGFQMEKEGIDPDTGQAEYSMIWRF